MVFGTTYCAISHLPICDGDKCILIPLGFNMKYSFNKWNTADINSFMYLYSFIHEPQKVIYNGNPSKIKYLNKTYEQTLEYELYMLVSYDFYNSIQKEYMKDDERLKSIDKLPLCKPLEEIWIKAKEIQNEYQEEIKHKISEKKAKGLKVSDKEINKLFNAPVPKWMKEIYKLAMFIDGMGIIPYPNHTVDQHMKNLLYEKIRQDCINKILKGK